MTRDQELWGVALTVLRQHGNDAPGKVADRIAELDREGKPEGVELWQRVAWRIDQLMCRPKLDN